MESPMPERQVMTRPACFALSRISPISPSVAEVSVMPALQWQLFESWPRAAEGVAAYAFTTIQRSVRHELGWSAPPGSIGLHTRIAVGLDLSSADDDPRLIFTDHQTARRQCCALPDGSYSRGWCWPNDISHLRHDMECWWMTIDPRGQPPSIPVIVRPRAAQHQTQHAEADRGYCGIAMMVVMAMMMTMALAGKGRARQAGDKDRRERIHAPGPDERLQSWPPALFVPHCCP